MSEQNQSADSLKDLRDIRQMMERSSRFISLSGLSGVAAGLCALVGAGLARYVFFADYYGKYKEYGYSGDAFQGLKFKLMMLAGVVLVLAFGSALYFTWRKTNKEGTVLWNHTSRKLFWNMIIPLVAGGFFILGMLHHNVWQFIAPACLVFYGLALVNASKYTFTDVRYLGYCEIVLGLLNMFWITYALYFWAVGFGVLHILYGLIMWRKYERGEKQHS